MLTVALGQLLRRALQYGFPVIVCMHLSHRTQTPQHIGYVLWSRVRYRVRETAKKNSHLELGTPQHVFDVRAFTCYPLGTCGGLIRLRKFWGPRGVLFAKRIQHTCGSECWEVEDVVDLPLQNVPKLTGGQSQLQGSYRVHKVTNLGLAVVHVSFKPCDQCKGVLTWQDRPRQRGVRVQNIARVLCARVLHVAQKVASNG